MPEAIAALLPKLEPVDNAQSKGTIIHIFIPIYPCTLFILVYLLYLYLLWLFAPWGTLLFWSTSLVRLSPTGDTLGCCKHKPFHDHDHEAKSPVQHDDIYLFTGIKYLEDHVSFSIS